LKGGKLIKNLTENKTTNRLGRRVRCKKKPIANFRHAHSFPEERVDTTFGSHTTFGSQRFVLQNKKQKQVVVGGENGCKSRTEEDENERRNDWKGLVGEEGKELSGKKQRNSNNFHVENAWEFQIARLIEFSEREDNNNKGKN